MEKILYDDKAGVIIYDDEVKALIVRSKRLPITDSYSDDYKRLLLKYKEIFSELKPQKVIFDFKELSLIITEEELKWTKDNITDYTYNNGLKYVAYVYPQDFISHFGMEQMVEVILTEYYNAVRNIFTDYQQAYQWIKSK